jgi:hypothetical protein
MLIMTLMVRNNEDVIGANIDFHLAMGVDHFIATDNGSEDASVDILRDYERKGVLTLYFEPADDFDQSVWVTRMARAAAEKWSARWVINNDADEFWWPLEGNLKATLDTIPVEQQVVVAPRFNFVAVEPAGEMFYQIMIFREIRSVNAVGKPLPPKACHRGSVDVVVGQGGHNVRWKGNPEAPMVSPERPIEILHFPLRSYSQFEAKIRLGGAALERNAKLPKGVGNTWRQLYRLYLEGGLPAYYESQTVDRDQAEASVRSGQLVRDTRLADWFADRDAGRSST